MKYNAALVSVSMLALSKAQIPSPEELSSYGLSLPQFEMIKASESPYDFDLQGQDQLWLDAATFSYELSIFHANNNGDSSLSYMPYLVCNESPGASGQERMEKIYDVFNNTTGVNSSDFYEIKSAVSNGANATCLITRAYNDTIAKVYGQNSGVEEWMKISPLHQSMKMSNMTVDIIHNRFDDIESEDYIKPDHPDSWFRYIDVLGSQSLLCPGVKDFEGVDVPDEEIQDSVKNFIIGDDGNNVKTASFFHQRVNDDTSNDVITERMTMWAGIISDVDDMGLQNGTNLCRENVIGEHFTFKVDGDNLNVASDINTDEFIKLAESLGLINEDLEKCGLYMTMGLALNPMICWVEPKTIVKALCPDGTSDLSQCPEPEPEVGNAGSSYFSAPARVALFSMVISAYYLYFR